MARILVVDDDALTLKLARAILEREGHEVITKDSWRSVNALVFKSSIDLMLLDVNIPGLTGDRMAEILRETRTGRNLPILLISDLPEKDLAARAESCRANGWLRKPLSRQSLRAAIEPMLESANRQRALSLDSKASD